MPDVSAIIPTRDRSGLLRQAVGSALRQRGAEVEVIVVDDGSLRPAADELGAAAQAVTVVRHERPRGVAAARNTGVAHARGRWLAFLDDDDVWSPDKASAQLRAAEAAGAGMAYGAALLVGPDLRPLRLMPAPPPQQLLDRLLAVNVIPAAASNLMVRADVAASAGPFDETFRHLDDWDMWLRLAARTPAASCGEVVVAWRRHAANRSTLDAPGVLAEFGRLRARHAELQRERGVELDAVDFGRYVASSLKRAGRRRAAAAAYVTALQGWRRPGNWLRAAAAFATPRDFGDTRQRAAAPDPEWLAALRTAS